MSCDGLDFTCITAGLEAHCASTGPGGGSLCAAIGLGEMATEAPISCILELITNFMNCGQVLTPAQLNAAYTAFVQVTGFKPFDQAGALNELENSLEVFANITVFYFIVPITIILVVAILLMAGFSWITWIAALFFSIAIIVVMYAVSVAYRISIENALRTRFSNLENAAVAANLNLQSTIGYVPQGLLAASCAIVGTGGTGTPWTCNPVPCAGGPGVCGDVSSGKGVSSVKGDSSGRDNNSTRSQDREKATNPRKVGCRPGMACNNLRKESTSRIKDSGVTGRKVVGPRAGAPIRFK